MLHGLTFMYSAGFVWGGGGVGVRGSFSLDVLQLATWDFVNLKHGI
jgi:hypothetical protein